MMSSDSSSYLGKTMPAQIPVPSAARQPSGPIPPAFASVPSIASLTADKEVYITLETQEKRVKKTGLTEVVGDVPRASVAGAPSTGSTSSPIATAGQPVPSTTAPLAVPTPVVPFPPDLALHPAPALGPEMATDEERALCYVLRLLNRVISPGTLSPVERAFVAGARVMFDQLSAECDRMLKRTVAMDAAAAAAETKAKGAAAAKAKGSRARKKPAKR